MPIRKGLRGGDFLSVTMPTARSEAKKNTTPSLVELASVLGSMRIHRAGEVELWGEAPRVSKFNF